MAVKTVFMQVMTAAPHPFKAVVVIGASTVSYSFIVS